MVGNGARRRPGPPPWLRWALPLMALLATGVWAARLSAQQEYIDREPQIKAAYLYNFGKYVEWPAETKAIGSAQGPDFVIGILGDSRVKEALVTLAKSKKLNGRRIVYHRITGDKSYRPCDILFVPAGQDAATVAAVLKKSAGAPTLVVGEEESFARRGGMINFFVEGNNVKFEINPRAAERAGLKISSKLLSLGRIVSQQ